MKSKFTFMILKILLNCGYAWIRKKWAKEYQFVEDNKGYTNGVKEFEDKRKTDKHNRQNI